MLLVMVLKIRRVLFMHHNRQSMFHAILTPASRATEYDK